MSAERAPALDRNAGWKRYLASLKYGLYVIFHPFDGFWDLSHEKRGSLAAANTFLAMFLLTYVLKLMCTNFQFINAPLQYINIYEQCASLLLPFLVLCVANWGLSTLWNAMVLLIVPLILRLFRRMRMEVEANERRKSAGFGS